MFRKGNNDIPSHIPVHKPDIAPLFFFIDTVKTENLEFPIIPEPMRVDKVSNSQAVLFIFPLNLTIAMDKNMHSYHNGGGNKAENGGYSLFVNDPIDLSSHIYKIENSYYVVNYLNLFKYGLKNLIKYTRAKYKEVCLRDLTDNMVSKWWSESNSISGYIPTYSEDFESIIRYYIEAYDEYLNTNDERGALILYCDKVIELCNKRIEDNRILSYRKGEIKEYKLYKEKKGKKFPTIAEVDIIKYKEKVVEGKDYKDNVMNNPMNNPMNNDKQSNLRRNPGSEALSLNAEEVQKIENRTNKKKADNKSKESKNKNSKAKMGAFIPVFIYDDLLECFLSNRLNLIQNSGDYIGFAEIESLGIIKKLNETELVNVGDKLIIEIKSKNHEGDSSRATKNGKTRERITKNKKELAEKDSFSRNPNFKVATVTQEKINYNKNKIQNINYNNLIKIYQKSLIKSLKKLDKEEIFK
ncbi:MAG: hypothetical protein ACTSU2_03900 [Promethearchaeota archaeon]